MRCLIVAVILAGCHSSGGGFGRYRSCEDNFPPTEAKQPAPADDDFVKLLAYRNYYSLDHVGAYEHHFAIWFQCIEPSVTMYAVSPEGEVRLAGGYWGGLAVRENDPAPVPADQQGNAKLVRAQHERDYDGASGERIQYLGSYREVTVGEIVSDSGPGDPYQRMVWHYQMTLRADADLGRFDGAQVAGGGYTKMCWEDSTYRDCSQPHWIAYTPPAVGKVQLEGLAEDAGFGDVVLAAARAEVAGEAGVAIDDILATQGTTFLPPGLATPVTAGFTIYARAGEGVEQTETTLRARLPAAEIARGTARASAEATIAGVTVRADFEASVTEPVEDIAGEQARTVRIRYTLRDSRGNERTGELLADGRLYIDGDAAVFRSLSLPDDFSNHIHEAPYAQTLPGAEGHAELGAYVLLGSELMP